MARVVRLRPLRVPVGHLNEAGFCSFCVAGAHGSAAAVFLTISIGQSGFALAADVLPTQGNVVNGTASINVNGRTMTIQQFMQLKSIHWQSSSKGAGNTAILRSTTRQPLTSAALKSTLVVC